MKISEYETCLLPAELVKQMFQRFWIRLGYDLRKLNKFLDLGIDDYLMS